MKLDFQLETRRIVKSAWETVLDLPKKRRMERAERQRTGRAPYPQGLSQIRPLLDELQEVTDSRVARDTTQHRPTRGFASGSGKYSNNDCSLGANPDRKRIGKVNKRTAEKRSYAEMLGRTTAALEPAQRPLKQRAIAEAWETTENSANSGLSDPRVKDDVSNDPSDLRSNAVSETLEDIDSLPARQIRTTVMVQMSAMTIVLNVVRTSLRTPVG